MNSEVAHTFTNYRKKEQRVKYFFNICLFCPPKSIESITGLQELHQHRQNHHDLCRSLLSEKKVLKLHFKLCTTYLLIYANKYIFLMLWYPIILTLKLSIKNELLFTAIQYNTAKQKTLLNLLIAYEWEMH